MATSFINDPDNAKIVAELYARGISIAEIADSLDVSSRTVYTWVRDPRVLAHTRRLLKERIGRITRSLDGEIEARLAQVADWDVDTILKVRKEYLDRPLKMLDGDATDLAGATNEVAEAMDKNPDLAEALTALLQGA